MYGACMHCMHVPYGGDGGGGAYIYERLASREVAASERVVALSS